jgi:hypothetical protein
MDTQVGSPPRALLTRRVVAWVCLGSFFLLAPLPIFAHNRYADLSDWYTDHLHHSFAVWVALHRGLDIYRVRFGEILANSGFRHPTPAWPQMPGFAYPPGIFAVFLPLTLIGQYVPMSYHAFGALSILFLLALTHLGAYAAYLALAEEPPGVRWAIWMLVYLTMIWMALQGFYDGIWVGLGAMQVRELARGRPELSLRYFAGAALLHFRAAVLAPLAVAALWQLVRGRKPRAWPWKELALLGVVGALVVWTFWLMYPATGAMRVPGMSLFDRKPKEFWVILGASAVAFGLSVALADVWVALSVAIATVLAVIHVNYWWHGAVLLIAPLSVGAARKTRFAPDARLALLIWALLIQPLAWRDSIAQLFVDLAYRLQHF